MRQSLLDEGLDEGDVVVLVELGEDKRDERGVGGLAVEGGLPDREQNAGVEVEVEEGRGRDYLGEELGDALPHRQAFAVEVDAHRLKDLFP